MVKKQTAKKPTKKVKKVCIDLACGSNKPKGYIGVDIVKTKDVDIVCDLNKYPWPFESDSVDELNVSHYVEHVDDIMKFIDECYRILKKGGRLTIVAPYWSSVRAWQDPTHVRAISESTFIYYNKKWRDDNGLSHYPIKSDFDYSYGFTYNPEFASRSEEAKAFAAQHYVNAVSDVHIMMFKR